MRRRESIAQNWRSIDDIADFVKTTQAHIETNLVSEPLPRKSHSEKEELIKAYLKKAEHREDVLNEKLVKQLLGGNSDLLTAPKSKFALNDPHIPREKDWLDSKPDSDLFDDIRQRVTTSKNRADEIDHSTAVANQYFQHEQDKANLYEKNLPGLNLERERGIVRVTHDLIDEVLNTLVPGLCSELLGKSKSSLDILNRSFIKAMTNFSDQNKRFLKMSGRIDVLKGALLDTEDEYHYSHGIDSSLELTNSPEANYLNSLKSMYSVGLTQSLIVPSSSGGAASGSAKSSSSGGEIAARHHEWKPSVQSTIHLTPEYFVHDSLSSQPLFQSEQTHVGQMSLQLINGAPLLLPINIPGKIVYTKCCRQHKDRKNSLVFVGTSKGRLLVYLTPWNAAAARLIAISPKSKDSKERVDVVDVRISPVGPQTIIVMNREGYVYVYHMNQAVEVHTDVSQNGLKNNRKSKGFFSSLFGSRNPNHTNNMDLLELNEIFKLNKYDVTLAVPLTKTVPTPYDKSLASVTVESDPEPSAGSVLSAVSKTVLNSNAIVLDKQMLPTVVSFHSSLSALGRSTSFMIGTSGGDIVKYNMDYHIPWMNCKILYPQNVIKRGMVHGSKSLPLPFVEKEYIHYHDAPSGFVLTNGNRENKGNHVYRELFHYHKSPVLVLDILEGMSDSLISIDEGGYMAVWKYSRDYLQEKHWFQPQTKAKLDFNHVQYVTVGDPVRFKNNGPGVPPEQWVPIVPSVDERMQLRRRHRGYDGKNHNVVMEIFHPIFSADLNSFVQYVCYTVTENVEVVLSYAVAEEPEASHPPAAAAVELPHNSHGSAPSHAEMPLVIDIPKKGDAPPPKVPEWAVQPPVSAASSHASTTPPFAAGGGSAAISASSVTPSAHMTASPKSSLNPLVHQAVTHLHQREKHQHLHPPGMKPLKTATVPKVSTYWSYQVVKEKSHQLKLESSRLVQDGADVVLLLSSRPIDVTPVSTSKKRKAAAVVTSTTYHFVPIHCSTLQFHNFYPHVVIDSSVDQLLDYCVGPVMAETLTRLLFVLTRKDGVRVFSLETGHELTSQVGGVDGFPFKCSSLKSFQPTRIAVCSSQRILTLTSSDDARMLVYVIKHAQDGIVLSVTESKTRNKNVPVAPINKAEHKRSEEYLRNLSVDTIQDIQVLPPAPLDAAHIDVSLLLDELLEGVFARAEMLAVRRHQAALVASLYGPPPYGFIEPVVWPPPEEEPVFEVEEPVKPATPQAVAPAAVEPVEIKPEYEHVPISKQPSTDSTQTQPEVKGDVDVESKDEKADPTTAPPPPAVAAEADKELNNSDSTILGICVLALEDVITSIILNDVTSKSTASLPAAAAAAAAVTGETSEGSLIEVAVREEKSDSKEKESTEVKGVVPTLEGVGVSEPEKSEVKPDEAVADGKPKSPAASESEVTTKMEQKTEPIEPQKEEENPAVETTEKAVESTEPKAASPERPDSGHAKSETSEISNTDRGNARQSPDSREPFRISSEDEWEKYNSKIQFEQSVHY